MCEDLVLRGIKDGRRAFVGPEIVQLDITNRCNNNCVCCWNNSPLLGSLSEKKMQERNAELPFSCIEAVVRELQKMGTKTIFLAGGGEPFMHPQIMDILHLLRSCDMQVCINTNATLISEAMAKDIVALKINHIRASLLAGDSDTYCAVHPSQSEDVFDRAVAVLRFIAEQKAEKEQHLGGPDYPLGPRPHIGMHYVLFNKNYKNIPAMVSLAMQVKADSIEFPLIDVVPGKTNSLLLSRDELTYVCDSMNEQCERIAHYNENEPVKLNVINKELLFARLMAPGAPQGVYEESTVLNQPCYVGWGFLRVLATGEVNSCLKSHHIPVGNVCEQSMSEIWNSPAQQLFREKTFARKEGDPFLKKIGNNPDSSFGCLDSCDNIQINYDMHERYKGEVTTYDDL